ncbi:uncharacterized protein [Watersipora subatra]|uniref:uncharacterized protein n=1 Tax=Watersipora subatra TaxID=2589382 RepID=UPI00355C84DE
MDKDLLKAGTDKRSEQEGEEDYVTIIENSASDQDGNSDEDRYEHVKVTEHVYTKLPKKVDKSSSKTSMTQGKGLSDEKPMHNLAEPLKKVDSGFLSASTSTYAPQNMSWPTFANNSWMINKSPLPVPAWNSYSVPAWNFTGRQVINPISVQGYTMPTSVLQNANYAYSAGYSQGALSLTLNHKCGPGISLVTIINIGILYLLKDTEQNLLCVNYGSPMTQKYSFSADGLGVTAVAEGFDFIFTLRIFHDRLECVRYDMELKNQEILFRMTKKKMSVCAESLTVMNNKQLMTMCNEKGKITCEFYNFNGMHMASVRLPTTLTSGRVMCLRDNSIVLYSHGSGKVANYVYSPKDVEATIRCADSNMKFHCLATDERGWIYGVSVEGDFGKVATQARLHIMTENWTLLHRCVLPSLDADTRFVRRLRVRHGWVTMECRPRGAFVYKLCQC